MGRDVVVVAAAAGSRGMAVVVFEREFYSFFL